MIIVIIAGGSGTRLWPLSQSNYPKHLLRLTGERSLLQNTVERARQLTDTIYVITEQSHAPEVEAQLPELPTERIIIEPARRGTASCIVLALASLAVHHDENEPVVFLHADHHITNQEAFVESVARAAKASVDHREITLIGVEPTYAATGLGYIERGQVVDEHNGLYDVLSFKEKPKLPTAKKYLASGNYVWNMGLFAAPSSVFHEAFTKYAPDLAAAGTAIRAVVGRSYEALTEVYLKLPSQPIDIALIEKTPNLLVVRGTFDWADIGSFFDLHRILQDKEHNSITGDVELMQSDDVMVHSTGERPIVVIGLTGVVVVDSPDGLLVCAKDKAQLVGEVAKKLARRPREEHL